MSPRALVTGASRGLGLALVGALVDRGWKVVVDGRDGDALHGAVDSLANLVIPIPGDVSDPAHREQLAGAVRSLGGIELLVNNASVLGPSPQPNLADYPIDEIRRVYEVNVVSPLALIQVVLPLLDSNGVIVNITSDAGVEGYPGWGGYGSSKAALEQISRILAAEHPELLVYWIDPGDMNTRLHQEAYPGEDISDRPSPAESVPPIIDLIERRPPSGRYRVADLIEVSR